MRLYTSEMRNKHVNVFLKQLTNASPRLYEAISYTHINKRTLYLHLNTEYVKPDCHGHLVNLIEIEFILSMFGKIEMVENVRFNDLWEDKFGNYNTTTISDYPYGYCKMDPAYIADISLQFLKDRGEVVGEKLNIL